jgi:hypothetical protein
MVLVYQHFSIFLRFSPLHSLHSLHFLSQLHVLVGHLWDNKQPIRGSLGLEQGRPLHTVRAVKGSCIHRQ